MTEIAKREEQASAFVSLAERWGIESEKLLPITKATIFKADAGKVSDAELTAFLMVCAKYNLNPFLRQIHAFYDDRRKAVVPIVGVDGWVDLINREKRFEGMEFKEHTDPNTGKLLAYTCRLYISGMRVPIEVTERLVECYRDTDPWRRMQHRMLRHKSLIQAGRYGFGYSGIYDEDEGRDIVAGTVEPFTEPKSLKEAEVPTYDYQGLTPPVPPSDEPVASEQPQVRPGCPGCQVAGMLHLEDCPNRPPPEGEQEAKEPKAGDPGDTEAPATALLLKEVHKMIKKYGLSLDTTGITAMECRLLLTKRTPAEVEKVIKTIEISRTDPPGPML
jgi:phage recombination protein Bet